MHVLGAGSGEGSRWRPAAVPVARRRAGPGRPAERPAAASVPTRQLVERRHQLRAPRSPVGHLHHLHRHRAPGPSRLRRDEPRRPSRRDLRHAVRRGGRHPGQEGRGIRLRRRERRGGSQHGPEPPLLPDTRRGDHAGPLDRGRSARQPGRLGRSPHADRRHGQQAAVRALCPSPRRRRVEGGFGGVLRPHEERPATRGLDLGGRRRPRHPARPRPLRRGLRIERDRARPSRHGPGHERVRLSRLSPGRQHRGCSADGGPAAPQGLEGHLLLPRPRAEDLPGAEEIRPDRGRQRLGPVRERRVRRPLGQRRPQPGVPRAQGLRLRGRDSLATSRRPPARRASGTRSSRSTRARRLSSATSTGTAARTS